MTHTTEQKAKMNFEVGQEVFTEDGRAAEYAGNIGGQDFVRIILSRHDDEYGEESWPSDKLTPVTKVFLTAPMEKHDKRVAEVAARISALRDEEAAIRRSVLDLQAREKTTIAALAKFPEMKTALDFLEGRITHVVIQSYGVVEIKPLKDALTQYEDSWGRRVESGMKLLCLFGHDKGKKPRWAINNYSDGSGTYTTVDPFTSEYAARAEVQRRADEAFTAWQADGKDNGLNAYRKAGAVIPQAYHDHCAKVAAASRDARIAELNAQIDKLREATP